MATSTMVALLSGRRPRDRAPARAGGPGRIESRIDYCGLIRSILTHCEYYEFLNRITTELADPWQLAGPWTSWLVGLVDRHPVCPVDLAVERAEVGLASGRLVVDLSFAAESFDIVGEVGP